MTDTAYLQAVNRLAENPAVTDQQRSTQADRADRIRNRAAGIADQINGIAEQIRTADTPISSIRAAPPSGGQSVIDLERAATGHLDAAEREAGLARQSFDQVIEISDRIIGIRNARKQRLEQRRTRIWITALIAAALVGFRVADNEAVALIPFAAAFHLTTDGWEPPRLYRAAAIWVAFTISACLIDSAIDTALPGGKTAAVGASNIGAAFTVLVIAAAAWLWYQTPATPPTNRKTYL